MIPTIKILQRTSLKNKDGTLTIYLRFTQKRIPHYFSLGIRCPEGSFNEKSKRISKTVQDALNNNRKIELYWKRAQDIIFDYMVRNKFLSPHEFKLQLFNSNYGSQSFFSFVDDQIKNYQAKFTPGTIKNYHDQANKLRGYRAMIDFEEIDNSFMLAYENYLRTARKNNDNTVIKSLTFVKNMVNKAVQQGVIQKSNITDIKLGRITGNREFLTMSEVSELHKLFEKGNLTKSKQNVLRYFLFCCYTGLRYSDVKSLKYTDIQDGIISLVMHKTKELVRIPVINKAAMLIPDQDTRFKNREIFRVLTDQPTNRYLKEIISIAGINKQISFHCARHTFATIGLNLGIPLEVISKLLGHTDLKTTQIYAKLEDSVRRHEMTKWE